MNYCRCKKCNRDFLSSSCCNGFKEDVIDSLRSEIVSLKSELYLKKMELDDYRKRLDDSMKMTCELRSRLKSQHNDYEYQIFESKSIEDDKTESFESKIENKDKEFMKIRDELDKLKFKSDLSDYNRQSQLNNILCAASCYFGVDCCSPKQLICMFRENLHPSKISRQPQRASTLDSFMKDEKARRKKLKAIIHDHQDRITSLERENKQLRTENNLLYDSALSHFDCPKDKKPLRIARTLITYNIFDVSPVTNDNVIKASPVTVNPLFPVTVNDHEVNSRISMSAGLEKEILTETQNMRAEVSFLKDKIKESCSQDNYFKKVIEEQDVQIKGLVSKLQEKEKEITRLYKSSHESLEKMQKDLEGRYDSLRERTIGMIPVDEHLKLQQVNHELNEHITFYKVKVAELQGKVEALTETKLNSRL